MVKKTFLAGDIGGTKTALQLADAEGLRPLAQKVYESNKYNTLEDIINVFYKEFCGPELIVSGACFAVAGPVTLGKARLTNLTWEVDADAIACRFEFPRVTLLNDFEAVGYGIEALAADDLTILQSCRATEHGTKVFVGAGTGLGVGYLTWQEDRYRVQASEGGHADFAPADDLQLRLLQHLRKIHGHVSYERIVSGPGLVAIFRFLCSVDPDKVSKELLLAMDQGDPAATIARFALGSQDPIAVSALNMFIDVYGSFAGNLALITLARGGVYIAGGIASKILSALKNGRFINAFTNKGRFASLLSTLPVHVVTNPYVGLLGAMVAASRS